MLPLIIGIIIVGIIGAYQATTIVDTSLPPIQNIPAYIASSIGSSGNPQPSSYQTFTPTVQNEANLIPSNMKVTLTLSNGKTVTAIISANDYSRLQSLVPSSDISSIYYSDSNPTDSLDSLLQFYQKNTNPQFATIALCGTIFNEYSYDKTDMATGGDIVNVQSLPPSESLTASYPNGTIALSLTNPKTNGCVTGNVIFGQSYKLDISGDYNGEIGFDTNQNNYLTITCQIGWTQNTEYDQFGNVITKYNPPIVHPAQCLTN